MGKHSDVVDGPGREGGERHILKRVLIVGTIVTVVAAVVAAGAAFWLNSSLDSIERFSVTVDEDSRPEPNVTEGLNILLLGADAGEERNGPGTSIVEDATKDTATVFQQRAGRKLIMLGYESDSSWVDAVEE